MQDSPKPRHSRRMDRSTLGLWIFALAVFLFVESCVLGVIVLMWMIDAGYLF